MVLADNDVLEDLLGGSDTLNGGTGNDTMTGGIGNDLYYVDVAGDVVTENASEGTDTVKTTMAAYTLGSNLEYLENSAATAFAGTGNALANNIKGNIGNDTLDGAAGVDVLAGGLGNDTYIIDLKAPVTGSILNGILQDSITTDTGGTDTIQLRGTGSTTVAHTLSLTSANQSIENIDANATGATLLNLTGNGAANLFTPNTANNTLNGLAGVDTMVGGTGNDIYVVDNVGDIVTEGAAAGTDTIQSSVSYTISANVEKLVLTGSAAITATGSGSADSLTGNLGANTLDGGAGADNMAGGEGNDTYVVDNLADVITETSTSVTQIDTVQTSLDNYVLGATNLENLTLLGAAIIGTGNARNNVLTGNASNNSLTGGAGNDTLDGGAGNDTLKAAQAVILIR